MQQKLTNPTLSPDRESKNHFGVEFPNNFVLSHDGHHVIAPDATDTSRILVEDLRNGLSVRFGENKSVIHTVFFDQDSRTLLVGDEAGHLLEYDLDLQKKKKKEARTSTSTIKDHKHLGIDVIQSCWGSTGFVFFGGSEYKVRVYDLSTRKMLPGEIDTAIGNIYSLRVCVVEES